jgi:hypothetical protein
MKKIIIWIIVIVLVILGIYFLAMRKSAVNTPQTILPGDANALIVADQNPNNLGVLVDSVSLVAPGFVVIHEDVNGAPGAIVGSSTLIPVGVRYNMNVITTLTPGKYYWAMLHTDDGNGIFNPATDVAANNPNGDAVMVRFMVKGVVKGENSKG